MVELCCLAPHVHVLGCGFGMELRCGHCPAFQWLGALLCAADNLGTARPDRADTRPRWCDLGRAMPSPNPVHHLSDPNPGVPFQQAWTLHKATSQARFVFPIPHHPGCPSIAPCVAPQCPTPPLLDVSFAPHYTRYLTIGNGNGSARGSRVHSGSLCGPQFGARCPPRYVRRNHVQRFGPHQPEKGEGDGGYTRWHTEHDGPHNRKHKRNTNNAFTGAGILHTIFFLRFFPSILPQTRDVLGLELAYVPEAEIETLIDQRVTALARQLESERHQPAQLGGGGGSGSGGPGLGLTGTTLSAGTSPPLLPLPPPSAGAGSGRGQVTVQFFEKRRRKTWYAMRGDDEVCWESWTVKVTVAEPRTEGGERFPLFLFPFLRRNISNLSPSYVPPCANDPPPHRAC